MNKKHYLTFLFLFSFCFGFAQIKDSLSVEELQRREKNIQAGNPFKKFGYKPKIATLSKGKYLEFHDLDSIVKIGSFSYHVKNKTITGYSNEETKYSEATLSPEIVSRWFSPDPLSDEFPEWSPYNFVMNNPIRLIDPNGLSPFDIVIKGDKEFTNNAFANLQALTDDILEIDENGKVTVADTSCNQGCKEGGGLVSDLINSESVVTIVETDGGNVTSGATVNADLKSDGSANIGAKEVTVNFNPNKETGGTDVNGSSKRPTEIGLGHELSHARNRINGVRDDSSSGVRDPDSPKGEGRILSKEEMNTRKQENKLRKERDVPLRKIEQ